MLAAVGAAEIIQSDAAPAVSADRVPATGATPVRLRHVDSLRAIAAGLVVWLHFDQFIRPVAGADPRWLGFVHTVPRFVDVGRMGVIIFFAISGFVICRSFGGPRERRGRRFVIRRLCRLYPAFWVSALGGVWLWWLMGRPLSWRVLAANVTMAPSAFNQEPLIGIYWTLQVELVFYALCLCLHRTRWLERPTTLAVTAVALTGLSRALRIIDHRAHPDLNLSVSRHVYCLGLAVMIWGALFRTVYDQTAGFRRGVLVHRGTWLILGCAVLMPIVLEPKFLWYLSGLGPPPPSGHLAVLGGIGIFALWAACLRVENSLLTYLGVLSYSIYLFHGVVLFTLTQTLTDHAAYRSLPCWLYILSASILTIGISAVIYRWVEKPAIALGKRWTGSDLTPATAPSAAV